jgi:hypothetical protein
MTGEEEMISLRANITGIDNTLFISPRDRSVKVANHPNSLDPRHGTTSISIDGGFAAGPIEPLLLYQVRDFIVRNRQTLTDYCDYRIDTNELITALVKT